VPDPQTITLTRSGETIQATPEEAGGLLQRGYTVESQPQQAQREDTEIRQERAPGLISTTALGAARAASLGLSDVVGKHVLGQAYTQFAKEGEEAHPYGTLAGEVIGSFTPLGPAGKLTSLGEDIIRYGEGASVLGRAGATAAGSAVIGAGMGAGNYVSQVALDDKPLSAEGFMGAMGKGALWGGLGGGALSLSSDALMRARALFPQAEVSAQAAQKIDQQATSQLTSALDDGDTMSMTAQQKLREMRVAKAQIDLTERQQLADIRVQTAQSKLDAQTARTARAQAPRAPRKAFDMPDAEAPAATAPEATAAAPAAPSPTPPPAPAEDPATLLERQLAGTKAALDQGKTIAEVGAMRPNVIGLDSSRAAMANASPEAAKLADAQDALVSSKQDVQDWLSKYGGKDSQVGRFERSQSARDYAEGMRPKEAGYYTKVPEGEGNVVLPRGRQSVFRGSAEEQAAAEASITNKVQPEDRLAADSAIDRMFGRKSASAIADDIVAGGSTTAPAMSLDDAIGSALKEHIGEHTNVMPDMNRAAKVIGNYEKAHADMVDALQALGLDVPANAVEQASGYRQAMAQHADASAASSAQAASDIKTKLEPALAKAGAGDIAKGAKSLLGKAGDAIGVLEALGTHVPMLHAIPVVGPLLATFLKAKAVMGIIGRKGGAVERTTESVIAAKAAQVRNRVSGAVKQMLDVGSKATRAAAPKAAAVAAIMGTQLMPTMNGKKAPKTDDLYEAYKARMDEVGRGLQPGVVQQAIASRIQTSDPAMLQAIVDQHQRGLQFLDSKAPKQTVMPDMMKSDGDYRPAKVQLEEWARYKAAVDDPAAVLENVAAGRAVTPEAAETLRTVYPQLYAEAQRTLLEHAQTLDRTLPYARRVTLSILFQVPVDGTMSAEHLQFLQTGASASPAQSPAGQGPAAAPPHPGISASVQVGTRTATALERRAGV
jgi:hypothetical protein